MNPTSASERLHQKAPSNWQLHERVCSLVERALSPGAVVGHDIRLPVIGSQRSRQCDVVVRYGNAPRELLAIVEVTSRGRRVGVNEIHAWYRKMQEVGAQLLLCVSRTGFSSSAIAAVEQQYGPSVRLHTLSELEASSAAADGLNLVTETTYNSLLVVDGDAVAEERSGTGEWVQFTGKLPLDTNDRIFRIGPRSPVSLWELALEAYQAMVREGAEVFVAKETFALSISCEDEPIHLAVGKRQLRLKSLVLELSLERHKFATMLWSYRQVRTERGLAWVQIFPAVPEARLPERVIGWLPTGTGAWFPVPLSEPIGSGHLMEFTATDDAGNELVLQFPEY